MCDLYKYDTLSRIKPIGAMDVILTKSTRLSCANQLKCVNQIPRMRIEHLSVYDIHH